MSEVSLNLILEAIYDVLHNDDNLEQETAV